MRIPGFVGAAGGETMASEAAIQCQFYRLLSVEGCEPMPLLLVILSFSSIGSGASALIVDVDVVRPRGFLIGPRWVSLNSIVALSIMV